MLYWKSEISCYSGVDSCIRLYGACCRVCCIWLNMSADSTMIITVLPRIPMRLWNWRLDHFTVVATIYSILYLLFFVRVRRVLVVFSDHSRIIFLVLQNKFTFSILQRGTWTYHDMPSSSLIRRRWWSSMEILVPSVSRHLWIIGRFQWNRPGTLLWDNSAATSTSGRVFRFSYFIRISLLVSLFSSTGTQSVILSSGCSVEIYFSFIMVSA